MPTASHTFLTSDDGMVDVGDSATLTSAWSAADVSQEWTTAGAVTAISERARKAATGSTWETIFGIPAGSTVTSVICNSWNERDWNPNVTSRRVRVRLINNSNTTAHSAGELIDVTGVPSNTTGVNTAQAGGSTRAIDATYQPSSTGIRLEIEVTATTSSTLDLEQNSVVVVATYTATSSTIPNLVMAPYLPTLG